MTHHTRPTKFTWNCDKIEALDFLDPQGRVVDRKVISAKGKPIEDTHSMYVKKWRPRSAAPDPRFVNMKYRGEG